MSFFVELIKVYFYIPSLSSSKLYPNLARIFGSNNIGESTNTHTLIKGDI